jgi:hypothetical protein
VNADINMRFERVSRVVADVLAHRRDLPAPHAIEINRPTWEVGFYRPDVAMQFTRLEDLIEWAKAWDVPIRVTEQDDYVDVTATQTINENLTFAVWGHMPHSDAWRLVTQHGKTLTRDGVDLDPDEVLASLMALRGAG